MARGSPRVSIGLPVYNGELYLAEALDGLLAQTFTDFEIVISDNGSTDDTERIGRAYAERDQRVRYVRHDRNRGGSWNYNRVFELTTAEYYMWHACDDRCAPTLLECCVAVLDQYPEVILCHANSVIIDERGRPIRDYTEHLHLTSPSPSRRYQQFLDHDRLCPLCSIYFGLMRREVVARTRLMLPHVNSESNLMSELALRGQFYELPEHLFERRDHAGISTRKYATHAERIAWYAPDRRGKGGHPGWAQLAAQGQSVLRVPMSPAEKARCGLVLLGYFGWLAQGSLRQMTAGWRQSGASA